MTSHPEVQLAIGLTVSLIVVYWATPVAIRVAARFDFYDQPTGYKAHGAPTPYLGGTAVMAGFLVTVLLLTGDWQRTLPVAGGAIAMWVIGTIDDRRTVTPELRVVIEVALGTLLWGAGLGWDFGVGPLADWGASVVWVVAVVNAFNLFDNMDGAASAMAAVVAGALAVLGLVNADLWLTVMSAALCGACIGFLPHNLSSPSRIFLGDGGSMPIGFTVAALAMAGAASAAAEWQSLAIGVLLVGVPALDTALVIVSRRRRRVSILTGGRDHITHRTHRRLRTARAVAVTLGAAQAMVSALALVAIRGSSTATVAVVVAYLVVAGLVIALLDSREPVATPVDGVADAPMQQPRVPAMPLAALFLVPLGVLIGISPFFGGYYGSDLWVPGGLGLVTVVAAGAIAHPPRLTRPAVLALGGLAGLALLALASALWTDSIEQAVVEGNRLILYSVLLATLLIMVRNRASAVWLLATIAVVALGLAGVTLVRMLGDDPGDLFIGGRLDAPLGYINGQGSFFLMALWLCVAVAEQRRRPILAGIGLGAASLLGCLLVLSQSRGVALAASISAVAVLALVPGRLRRVGALIVLAAGVALAGAPLLDVYESRPAVDAGAAHSAAKGTLLVAVGTGLVWGLSTFAAGRAGSLTPVLRRGAAGALAAATLAAGVVAVAEQAAIRETAREQYTAFVKLGIEPQGSSELGGNETSRLVSGAGTRYDYWRIAWDAWQDHPIGGGGAGNYDKPYFAQRATTEDVRQPHSIALQALSELGLIGALLLASFLGGVGWAAWRLAAAARVSEGARFLSVAATGAFTAWLVHTSVDWIHLLPGVTAIALAAAAAMLTASGDGERERATRRAWPAPPRLVPAIAVGVLLALASASLSRQGLAEHFQSQAQEALRNRPADALVEADRALRLDAEAIRAYYVKAAALARFDRGPAARAVLLEAARREPQDFVTWTLLGDLAVRMGNTADARLFYRRALALNPRDPPLRRLVRNPEANVQ